MYSDMSTWIIASSSPKRNSASVRAGSRLPDARGAEEDEPEPVGRFGSLIPARARRIDFETATIAWCWPITRLCSSSSIERAAATRPRSTRRPGSPSTSRRCPRSRSARLPGCSSDSSERQLSSNSFFFCVQLALLVAQRRGLLELLRLDHVLLLRPHPLDLVLELAVAQRRGRRRRSGAARRPRRSGRSPCPAGADPGCSGRPARPPARNASSEIWQRWCAS